MEGIRVRYADFMTLLSIFKGTLDMNQNSLEKCEMSVLHLDFKTKLDLSTPANFSFSETFRDKYEGNKILIC